MSALNDLGSLQGLITLSIGALVSIKVLNLRIRVGNTAIIKGNDNVVQFITNNFYANNEYRLSFGFRCLLLMLVLSCVMVVWLPKFLVVQVVALCITLITISAIGMFSSNNGMNATCYFLSTIFIS